jgi:hypothetical protein
VREAQPDAVPRNVVKQYADQAIRPFKNGGRRNGRKEEGQVKASRHGEGKTPIVQRPRGNQIAEAVRIIEVRVKKGLEEIRVLRRALLGRARLRHQDKS